MATLLTGRSYAKINLGLRILRKRPDGYHDLETVFHRIGLHDVVEVSLQNGLSVTSTDPAAPSDSTNLAHRAAELLRDETGSTAGARIALTKRIPVGAGLGGGSSNAATVLKLLQDLWNVHVSPSRLHDIALRIGSDVPYFLGDGSAAAAGRGERLDYFDLRLPYAVLLVAPRIHVSTAWAYGQITPRRSDPATPLKDDLLGTLHRHASLRIALTNDFEPSVFARFPEIAAIKQSFLDAGAVGAAMSGSGSSVFGLFTSEESAAAAARSVTMPGATVHVTPPFFTA